MNAYRRNPCTPTSSLAAEIGEVERRLRRRQRLLQVRTATLGQTLRQRMTAAVTLIWTGAIGFLIGEVNQAQQEKEKLINEARRDYNKVIPLAEGETDQRIREADGYRLKRINYNESVRPKIYDRMISERRQIAENTTLILSTDSDLFKFLKGMNPSRQNGLMPLSDDSR